MKNEYIEVAKRFMSGEEVSVKALKANTDAAWAAYAWVYADAADDAASQAWVYAAAAYAAYAAADAAAKAADAELLPAANAAYAAYAAVAHWVKRYEELTK